jgi:arginine:pyruvate transaminase
MPEFSPLVERVGGKGAEGWAVHSAARHAEARGEDVVVLSVGDPDFATPAGVVDRAIEVLDAGDTHYSDIAGRSHLRSAIADYVGRLAGVSYEAANVMVSAGTQNALFNTSLCLLGPGDEVIVPDPAYLTYEASLRVGGATLVPVPLTDQFRLDPPSIAAAVTSATRAIIVNSPANPTGVVASRAELRAIAEIALTNDLWVISDEVYAELVFSDERHHSIAAEPGMAERTVVVGALSKSHAMTGWRIGWAVGPPQLVQHMATVALCMNYGLPGFIQEAATVAIEKHRADVDEMRKIYRRRRDLTAFMLAEAPGVDLLVPEAGMFVLADVRGTGLSSQAFSELLFDEQRVSVLDAGNFGARADGWIRISFTIDDVRLAEGCRRIVDFCHTTR